MNALDRAWNSRDRRLTKMDEIRRVQREEDGLDLVEYLAENTYTDWGFARYIVHRVGYYEFRDEIARMALLYGPTEDDPEERALWDLVVDYTLEIIDFQG